MNANTCERENAGVYLQGCIPHFVIIGFAVILCSWNSGVEFLRVLQYG